MGCCLSKDYEAYQTENPILAASRQTEPPPHPEEETVKEVLSETPKLRVSRVGREERKEEVGIDKRSYLRDLLNGGRDERFEEEASSEICSLSEGFSVSTMETEKRGEDEALVKKRRDEASSPAKFRKKRSFSGELSCKRERCAAAAAGLGCRTTGRSSLSPARRRAGAEGAAVGRTLSAREAETAARIRAPAGSAVRRDPGERSARRSPSPAAKRPSEPRPIARHCRSSSAPRPCGRLSPRRVRPAASEYGVRRGYEALGERQLGGKESLDNPLVSLECFIFL